MSLGSVLWIVGTALAASGEDPRVAAATDGESIWVTRDSGLRWRRVAGFEDTDDGGDDLGDGAVRVGTDVIDILASDPGEPDAAPRTVRALALIGDELVVAGDDGVVAFPLRGGAARRRATRQLDALAVSDGVLWAVSGRALLRSADQGGTFDEVLSLPAGGAASLAVTRDRALVGTPADVLLVDLSTGRSARLGCGGAAVAASGDGSLWRAGPWGVQRSIDGGDTWRDVAAVGGRAVAVGTSDIWIATGGRVARLGDLERSAAASSAIDWRARAHEAALRAAGWRRPSLLPRVIARAVWIRRDAGDPGAEREARIEVLLEWDLDGPRGTP